MVICIDDLLGIPYKTNGRDKDGYDCMGLTIEVEKRFGHTLVDLEENKLKDRSFQQLANKTIPLMNIKQIDKPTTPGDMVLFLDNSGLLHHIGVYLGNDMFIHCDFRGVHIDRFNKYPDRIGRIYTWL